MSAFVEKAMLIAGNYALSVSAVANGGAPAGYSLAGWNELETHLKTVEAALKDAERFAWLIENARTGSLGFGDWWINADEPASEWRAALDAAMLATKQEQSK